MTGHLHIRRLRKAAALVPLLVLAMTATGCGPGTGTPASRAGSAASTTGTGRPAAPDSPAAPTDGRAAPPPAGEATPNAAASQAPPAAAPPEQKQPPPPAAAAPQGTAQPDGAAGSGLRPVDPGTYRYTTEGTVQVGDAPPRDMPQRTTLTGDRPQSNRQRQVRDLRDGDGTGTVTEQILQFDSDGVRLTFMKISSTFAGVSSTYTFTPAQPPLVLKAGLRPGDRTQFVLKGNGVTIRTTVSVTGSEQAVVDGTPVRAAVVVIDSALSGRLTGKQRSENRIDTERGLAVKEDVDSDVTSGSVRVRSKYRAGLTNLAAG